MPSVSDVLFVSIFARTLTLGGELLNDGDTGWHIRTGEHILDTMTIPHADIFSHTAPGAPWTIYSWLADVVFASVHGLAGLNGIVTLTAAVIAFTFAALYRSMLKMAVNPVSAAALTAIAAAASSGHWLARPHVFSFPLTLAFMFILDRYWHGETKHIHFLPALMVLWVNLHPGFMLGLALVFIYALCGLYAYLSSPGTGQHEKAMLWTLGITAVLTTLAACINPYGPAILYLPFDAEGIGYVMTNIREWASPDFHVEKGFEFMLLLYLGIFVMSRKGPDLAGGAVSLLLTAMALSAVRYIPLTALAVTIVTARMADDVTGQFAERLSANKAARYAAGRIRGISASTAAMERRPRPYAWALLFAAACSLVALNSGRAFGTHLMHYSHDPARFPVAAVEYAHENGITGRMFNDYGWGGYIIYRGFPEQKVFVDGRIAPYGPSVMRDYLKVSRADISSADILDKYKVDWVLYSTGSPLCRLLASGGWKRVYADDTAELLVRGQHRYGSPAEKDRPYDSQTGPRRITHEN